MRPCWDDHLTTWMSSFCLSRVMPVHRSVESHQTIDICYFCLPHQLFFGEMSLLHSYVVWRAVSTTTTTTLSQGQAWGIRLPSQSQVLVQGTTWSGPVTLSPDSCRSSWEGVPSLCWGARAVRSPRGKHAVIWEMPPENEGETERAQFRDGGSFLMTQLEVYSAQPGLYRFMSQCTLSFLLMLVWGRFLWLETTRVSD